MHDPERHGDTRPRAEHPKLWVFLFSLIPGAGHMYLGLMTRGVQLMALFFGTLSLTVLVGGLMQQVWSMGVAPILWFYSFFDALQAAGQLRRGEDVPDQSLPLFVGQTVPWGRAAGWTLILLGALALLENLGFLVPGLHLWIRRLFGPAALLAIGAWLLLRDPHTEPEDTTPNEEA